MAFISKRAYSRARRDYVRSRMRYRNSPPPRIAINSAETRDELLIRARRILELLVWKRQSAPFKVSRYEILAGLREAAALRAYASTAARIDPTDRAFYVSMREGNRQALLYGPFATQRAALNAQRVATAAAREHASADAAFAAFGTCSIAARYANPGKLNHVLPAIPTFPPAGHVLSAASDTLTTSHAA